MKLMRRSLLLSLFVLFCRLCTAAEFPGGAFVYPFPKYIGDLTVDAKDSTLVPFGMFMPDGSIPCTNVIFRYQCEHKEGRVKWTPT